MIFNLITHNAGNYRYRYSLPNGYTIQDHHVSMCYRFNTLQIYYFYCYYKYIYYLFFVNLY